MAQSNKYSQPSLTTKSVMKKLEGSSPLQVSKALIDMELYDQQSSLEVLSSIYEEFENKDNVIDELVTPMGMSVLDSLISHPKLKLTRTGLTASRVWSEINGFEYRKSVELKQQSKEMNKTKANERGNVQAIKLDKHKQENTNSDGKIINEIDGSSLVRHGESNSTNETVNTDHIVSADTLHKQLGNNAFLTSKDEKVIVNHDQNLASISEAQNKSKGAGKFQDIKDKKSKLERKRENGTISSKEQKSLDKINDAFPEGSLEKGIKLEEKAESDVLNNAQNAAKENIKNNKSEIIKKAGSQAGVQTAYQAIGHAIILLIKPVFFEINDSIKNGFDRGVKKSSIQEGLKFRFNRVMDYIRENILPTLAGVVKDFCSNFFKVLIDGVLGLVTGLFKSIMKIVSEGFLAFVEAWKIITQKPTEENPIVRTQAEKADAILKLFSTTVTTFIIFHFESTVFSALPDNFIKDFVLSLFSGIASTIVVYALDKWDVFSVKAEQRAKKVKEIFEMRIQQIKENTDAFEAASIDKLAKDKLKFRSITENMSKAIDSKSNVNDSVYDMADFMKIDLKIKSTDDFMDLLKQGSLAI